MTLPLETRRAARNRLIAWFAYDLLIATAIIVVTVQIVRGLPYVVETMATASPQPALVASDQAASRPAPSGFDQAQGVTR
jgi:hypothetical protein